MRGWPNWRRRPPRSCVFDAVSFQPITPTPGTPVPVRHVLHLLTQPPDDLVTGLLDHQRALASRGELQVEVIDLAAPGVDMDAVLDRVFAADATSTW